MAVILPPRRVIFGSKGIALESDKHNIKLDLDLKREVGKHVLFGTPEFYLSGPVHGLNRVEAQQDAQVPDYNEPSSILDLSTPTLDTPSILESLVDVLPFRFGNGSAPDPLPQTEDLASDESGRSMLGIEDNAETFQNLAGLMADPPMPVASTSPTPLLSPTGSIYSDVTGNSPASMMSAASTSSDTRFSFAPDFEEIGSVSVKSEGGGKDNRYVEMRRRNNLASKRSRMTRREKERDMEGQLQDLLKENASLKARVQTLDDLVEKTKSIIMNVITNRNA